MKAVILAGGIGTRISEESYLKPKPMIEIGGMPILWHIMKIYSAYDINEFVICLGYKGYQIKEFFANYNLHMSDITIDIQKNNLDEQFILYPNPSKVPIMSIEGALRISSVRGLKLKPHIATTVSAGLGSNCCMRSITRTRAC